MRGKLIGQVLGALIGISCGLVVATPPGDVTVDAQSGKATPATATEWSTVLAKAKDMSGGPASIYLMQDMSGGAADVLGSNQLLETGAGAGHFSYRNVVPGWSRLALGTIHGTVDIGFVKQGGNLPSEQMNAYLLLAYVMIMNDAGVDTGILSTCDASFYAAIKTGTRYITTGGSGGPVATGSKALPIGSVFPVWLKYDPFTAKVVKVYTPYEVIGQQSLTPSDQGPEVDFGIALATGLFASNARYLYGTLFTGAAAQKSDATIGTITQQLGWDVTWADAIVPQDGPLDIYVPRGPAQWSARRLAIPGHQWPLQETAGITYQDVSDCPLIASAGITGGNAIPNWSRFGLATVDGTVQQYAAANDSRLPDASQESVALFLLADVQAAAHGTVGTLWSWIGGFETPQFHFFHMQPGGQVGVYGGGPLTSGTVDHRGSVHGYLFMIDRTNQRVVLFTDQEKIVSSSYVAPTAYGQTCLGSPSNVVPAVGMLATDLIELAGADAEFSDADARSFFANLNFPAVPW